MIDDGSALMHPRSVPKVRFSENVASGGREGFTPNPLNLSTERPAGQPQPSAFLNSSMNMIELEEFVKIKWYNALWKCPGSEIFASGQTACQPATTNPRAASDSRDIDIF